MIPIQSTAEPSPLPVAAALQVKMSDGTVLVYEFPELRGEACSFSSKWDRVEDRWNPRDSLVSAHYKVQLELEGHGRYVVTLTHPHSADAASD